MRLIKNLQRGAPARSRAFSFVDVDAPARVRAFLSQCPIYRPTPLRRLDTLAAELGVGHILYKDESQRLNLQSFKALGGTYAIMEILRDRAADQLGRNVEPHEVLSSDVRAIARDLTFICASDGNHGRSVAAGARLVGARCIVFLHEGVSDNRVAHIAGLGAEIRRTKGSYDESVEEANHAAARNRWVLVADTAISERDDVPGLIMRGYTVVPDEILNQLSAQGANATHLFVQAGVGGLAAAVCGHLEARLGNRRPRVVVVEPESSACLFESCVKGRATQIEYRGPTVYAMLECNRPSPLAWEILYRCGDAFMTVEDDMAEAAMRRLALAGGQDMPIVAGESGAAGVAALMSLGRARETIGLGRDSTVIVIGTEGATDPAVYAARTGTSPEAVLRGRH